MIPISIITKGREIKTVLLVGKYFMKSAVLLLLLVLLLLSHCCALGINFY